MSIDVFGRHLGSSKVAKGPPGIGFNLTKTGDFNLEQKKFCNVGNAVDDNDAVNLSILTKKVEQELNSVIGEVEYLIIQVENKVELLEEGTKKRLDKIYQVLDIPEDTQDEQYPKNVG